MDDIFMKGGRLFFFKGVPDFKMEHSLKMGFLFRIFRHHFDLK